MKRLIKQIMSIAIIAAISPAFAQSPPEAASTVGATYVEPSATKPIKPADKIDNLFARNMEQPYVLQRLTDRSYFFQRFFYSTTFYVGDEGVLLFDAPEGRGAQILQAIREVTPLPVTTVVYSHFHVDHIGDAQFWVDQAQESGGLRIVSSKETADKMAFMNSQLPKPTRVLSGLKNEFKFEDLTLEMHRFAKPAHTDDHSVWLLKEQKVAHSPDLLNPDQLPMLGFAVSDTAVYHQANLEEVMALDWTYFVGGHGNIGYREDFEFQLAFLEDLREATLKARQEEAFAGHMTPDENNHAAFARSQRDAIIMRVTEELRPKYGKMYGYDASMPYNVELAIRLVGSYY
ncbi:MBL fold metallo-hydrolase [Halopseudomonas sp. SMJS2]|uniref:MBL fold metallo-hydrolase n=1 Tax=Halopseudomonas sp. SMJS2 TaxID=3041098 RepID=UPI002452ED88|nr:MBL fold metallo-hydrolase [Halopseudomonas sp. SMJS2]WGK61871.1 MBL fold metallo-hydrolase [Halopseudomonas sp. SMJS2]